MILTKKSFVLPFALALGTGTIFNMLFDRIPLLGTRIPSCGYYSTVVFTEPSPNIYLVYFLITLIKGLFYLGSFYLFQKLLSSS